MLMRYHGCIFIKIFLRKQDKLKIKKKSKRGKHTRKVGKCMCVCYIWKERHGLPISISDYIVFYENVTNFKNTCSCIKSKCTENFTTRDSNLMLIYFAQIINNNKLIMLKQRNYPLLPLRIYSDVKKTILYYRISLRQNVIFRSL